MIILDGNLLSQLMKPKKSGIVRNLAALKFLMSLFTRTIIQAEINSNFAVAEVNYGNYN